MGVASRRWRIPTPGTRRPTDPAPYLAAAATLGVDPTTCIVFEDTTPGIQSARSAGATVIAVGSHAQGADYRIRDLRQVRVAMNADGMAITIR